MHKDTAWFPCEGLGSYYRLENDVLLVAPMQKDGSLDVDTDDSVETAACRLVEQVAFDCIDEDVAAACRLIEDALRNPEKYEGEPGDVLPLACEKCHSRFGNECQHVSKEVPRA